MRCAWALDLDVGFVDIAAVASVTAPAVSLL
jgi:hypothetical protein